jgi:hypothetical protein
MGKVLRVQRTAPPRRATLAGDLNADERVYAYGFARPSDFAFTGGGRLFGTDATGGREELNVSPGGTMAGGRRRIPARGLQPAAG